MLILSLSCSYAQVNFEDEPWNPGYLVTNDEDSLFGPVRINFGADLVQINEENSVKTFAANQILQVYYKDNTGENEHYIYSFPYHPFSDFKPKKFFEMLFSGKFLSLLARSFWVSETVPIYDNFTYRTVFTTRVRLATEYYFMYPGKKVRIFGGNKKDLFVQLADKKDALKKILSENKLDLSNREDLVFIVKEYNKIKLP